jgi:copper(I)-binding protein
MNHKPLNYSLLIILCFFKSAYASDSALLVENAWIAEAPPVSKVMVAYMTLINTGSEAIDIIAAESDTYSSIEFHQTVHENGMAKMIRHSKLTLAPNESLQLKRGGVHLMLFNPAKRLKAGDTVDIQLSTKNGLNQSIAIPVKKTQF